MKSWLEMQAESFIAQVEQAYSKSIGDMSSESLWNYAEYNGIELSSEVQRLIVSEQVRRHMRAIGLQEAPPRPSQHASGPGATFGLPLATQSAPNTPPKPDLSGLLAKADFLPLDLRKRVRASIGDHSAEIDDLYRAGKYKAARVTKWWAVVTAVYICLRMPIDAAFDRLTKAFGR